MLNEEKIQAMTDLAVFEKHQGRKIFPVNQFFKSDYVGGQLFRSFYVDHVQDGRDRKRRCYRNGCVMGKKLGTGLYNRTGVLSSYYMEDLFQTI